MDAHLARLLESGVAAQATGQFEWLERTARDLIEYCAACGDFERLATAYRWLGNARHYLSDAKGAEIAYKRALEIAQEHDQRLEEALVLVALGNLALEQRRDLVEGLRLHKLAEPTIRASADMRQIGILTGNLSEIARSSGDYDRALAYAQESLDAFRAARDEHRAGWQRTNIALIYAQQHDYLRAAVALRDAWQTLSATPNAYWTAMYFNVCFLIAVDIQQWEVAATLDGFTAQYRMDKRVPRLPGLMTAWYPSAMKRFARSLPAARIGELRARGANLSVPEAHTLAMTLFTPST